MKLPAEPSPALSFGITVHALLRAIYQAGFGKTKLSMAIVDQLIDQYWVSGGYDGKAHELEAKKNAKKLMEAYMERNADEMILPAQTEYPFQFFLPLKKMGQPLKVMGRFDRVNVLSDGKIEIVDYKTGLNVPDEKKVKNDLQLTLYALAATQIADPIFKKSPDQILLTLNYIEPNVQITTSRTKEQLEEAKEKILEKVSQIEQSEFYCNGSIFCKTCEYHMLCSTYKN